MKMISIAVNPMLVVTVIEMVMTLALALLCVDIVSLKRVLYVTEQHYAVRLIVFFLWIVFSFTKANLFYNPAHHWVWSLKNGKISKRTLFLQVSM